MINDIRVYFSSNPNKAYHCVSGSVFNDEFGETLDSASIILDEIPKQDRLSNIEPYEYVKIVNNSDSFLESKFMLVDNYVEKETNIHEHIFQYTINLMSETKLLEKIQCPNLVITHSKKYGKKPIWKYIHQYMKLYCPKVKIYKDDGTWDYDYIIKWDATSWNSKIKERFNVDCADMSMSLPTLRQVLTSLMQQVGCIPVVKNRELTFLDFKQEKAIFNKVNSINYIQKSLSSDSYVNTLVNHHNQVLDTGNEVISETLGFRNRNNVLLKQKENLTLETKFPIYDVNKFMMNIVTMGYANIKMKAKNTYDSFFEQNLIYGKDITYPFITGINYKKSDNLTKYVDIQFYFHQPTIKHKKCLVSNLKIYILKRKRETVLGRNSYRYYKIGEEILFEDGLLIEKPESDEEGYKRPFIVTYNKNNKTTLVEEVNPDEFWDGLFPHDGVIYEIQPQQVLVTEEIGDDNLYVYMEGDLVDIDENYKTTQVVPITYWNGTYYNEMQYENIPVITKLDISPLIIENNKRNLLNVNFTKMEEVSTLEELSQYVYGTIGYSIGTKQISGFSQMYNKSVGWWKEEYTYIENILNLIRKKELISSLNIKIEKDSVLPYLAYIDNFYYEPDYAMDDLLNLQDNFATISFDIQYQPLNTYNLKYVKEDKDIPLFIEQLDSSNSAIVDFDRTSLNEQEKVNRLGNDIITINQVTDNYEEIQPLNSLYEDYTIFKRTISFENGYFKVNYAASKNYIMQNYFTSITTKYRAFENVDYSQSVIRKENQTVFVYFTEDVRKGADILGKLDKNIKNLDKTLLVSGMENYDENNGKINYSYEKGVYKAGEQSGNESYKNDVSTITSKNLIAFIYENYDNVSPGSYLTSYIVDESTQLGGIPQEFLIYNNDYYESHEVGYLNRIITLWDNAFKYPLIENDNYKNKIIFNLVDDNTKNDLMRTFYKDNAEIINQTVQFVYYTDSKNILWTDYFIENNKMVDKCNLKPKYVIDISNKNFDVGLGYFDYDVSIIGELSSLMDSGAIIIDEFAISINWDKLNGATKIKISTNTSTENNKYYDFIAFRKNEYNYQSFYYGLNDTKTFRIYNTIKEGENKDLIYLE